MEEVRESRGEGEERGNLEVVVVVEERIFPSSHPRWRPSPSLKRGGVYISLLSQVC